MNTDPGSPREPSGEASLERVAGLLQPEISSISSRLESDPSFIPPTLEEIAKKIGLSVELATKVLEASEDEGIKQYLKAEQEVLKRADELGPIQTRSYVWLTLARLDEEVRIPSLPTLAAQYDTSELVVKLVLRKLKPEDRELFLERAQKTEQLDLQDNVAAAVLGVVIANVATPGIQVDPVKFDQATARQFRCEPDQVKRIREKLRVGRELFVEGATEQPVLELAQTQPTSTTVTTTRTPEAEEESPETAPEKDPSTFVAELTAIANGEAPIPEGVTTANGLGDALGMRRGQFVYARRQLDHDT
ncbi:MAG: hypothetical protein KDD70_10690, partial [Bdellovibrionales bacterium]|nr:hypothetical protein [Bdellovibrionales bacterium]